MRQSATRNLAAALACLVGLAGLLSASGFAAPSDRGAGGGRSALEEAATYPGLPYGDVDGAVAEALLRLKPTGALAAFPGDRFRPDRAITLGEFARLAASAFRVTLPAGSDPEQAAVAALQERGVLPEGAGDGVGLPISRLNLLEGALRLAGSAELLAAVGQPGGPGEAGPEAAGNAEAVERLAQAADLMPSAYGAGLQPNRPATRGEAAWVMDRARHLSTLAGQVERVAEDGTVELGRAAQASAEAPAVLRPGPRTLVVRDGQITSPSALQPGDAVLALMAPGGRAAAIVATAPALAAEWVEQALALLRSAAQQLTVEQWQLVLQGDWDGLAATLTPAAYDYLMKAGLAPWEVDAIVNRDWQAVQALGLDRAAQEAARRLGVSPQVVRAVLAQDWPTARQLAEQELLQRLLQELLGQPPAGGPAPPPGTDAAGSGGQPAFRPAPPGFPAR